MANVKADETNADADLPVFTKKMKKEQGKESDKFPGGTLVLSTKGEGNNNASNTENKVDGQMTNGSIGKTNGEGGHLSKETKMEKKLKEPKSITPFQRVKVDEVKFADQRLQDNSYWAKAILMVVLILDMVQRHKKFLGKCEEGILGMKRPRKKGVPIGED